MNLDDFCRGYFHVDECFEWSEPGQCCNGGGEWCCRKEVHGTVRVGEWSRAYHNIFKGSSETNVHVEEQMVADVELGAVLAAAPLDHEVLFYIGYNPCNHSAGGRHHGPRPHVKSCAKLLVQWWTPERARGRSLNIKCCSLYRAHWDQPDLFKSDHDRVAYVPRTNAAREGIHMLLAHPGITMGAMRPVDWEDLFRLLQVNPRPGPEQLAHRHLHDEQIERFIRDQQQQPR